MGQHHHNLYVSAGAGVFVGWQTVRAQTQRNNLCRIFHRGGGLLHSYYCFLGCDYGTNFYGAGGPSLWFFVCCHIPVLYSDEYPRHDFALRGSAMVQNEAHSGQMAGLLYFISTLGSAAGTLGTSFYFVLWFEVNQILWGAIFTLLLAGLVILRRIISEG